MLLDYSRQTGAADLAVLQASHVVAVGIGSASLLYKTLARIGLGRLTCVDYDVVEFRNVTSQGYTFADAQQKRSKVDALRDECLAINPELNFTGLQQDFVTLPDDRLKALLSDVDLLIMTTDHHPAQARGALAGLVCDVPVLSGAMYRRGRAGEIIFQYPGLTKTCYRCITRYRFDFVAQHRTSGTGDATGSLPFTPMFVDAILGFLTVGILHKRRGAQDNPYARWFERIGNRNFIQTRLDPDYRLGTEDIFGDVFGHDERVFCCDTIWQPGEPEIQPHCPYCHGKGAIPVGVRLGESTCLVQSPFGGLVQQGTEVW